MTSPIPLVSASQAQTWMEIVAWVTGAVILISLTVAVAILRYNGIDHNQRRHLYAIKPQLLEATPRDIPINREQRFAVESQEIRKSLSGLEVERVEPRVRDTAKALLQAVRANLPDVPKLALESVTEGLAILVFGVILSASASWYEWLTSSGASGLPGPELLWTIINALPGIRVLSTSGLAVIFVVYNLFLTYWLPVALVLLVGGIALVYLDYSTRDEVEIRLYDSHRRLAVRVGLWLGLIYVVGAVPTFLAGLAGFGDVGGLIGIGLSSAVTAYASWEAGTDVIHRLRTRHPVGRFEDDFKRAVIAGENLEQVLTAKGYVDVVSPRRKVSVQHVDLYLSYAYILVRKTIGVLAILSIPVLLWIGGQAMWRLLTVAASHPLISIVVVALLGVVIAKALQTIAQDEYLALRRAVVHWWRSASVRWWVFARGVPYTAMSMTFLFVWAFGLTVPLGGIPVLSDILGLWPPFLASVIVGVIVRALTLGWEKAKYQFVDFDSEATGPSKVVVSVYPPIVDDNDERLYVVRVGGHHLAHRDIEPLLADVERILDDKFNGNEVSTTFSAYYWEDLTFGTVDIEQVRRELRGDIRSRMLATIRENGPVDKEVIEEKMPRHYPTDAVEAAKSGLLSRVDVSIEDDQYVYHR